MNAFSDPLSDVLKITNLDKKFDSRFAVKNASWSAANGQIICLLGHSGCGKTTMLRLIAGLETPTSGKIELNQATLWSEKEHIAPEERNIGLVFQDYALFPHLSVLENVMFGLKKIPKKNRQAVAEQALKHVSMHHHIQSFPYTLSGGEQQRVALARALAPEPNVLLMDEPFSNLDHRLRDQIRKSTIDLLKQTKTTAVIVTHDPEEALQIADQIILMHQAEILQIGSPKQLYFKPTSLFVARYFSALNEFPCSFIAGTLETVFGHIAAPSHLLDDTQAKVTGYVRHHQVLVSRSSIEGGVVAQVISSSFGGHVSEVVLQLKNFSNTFTALVNHQDDFLVNDQVYVAINLSEAFFFHSEIEDSGH